MCKGLHGTWKFQEVEAPRFPDNRHIKVGKVDSPRHGPPVPPPQETFLALISVRGWVNSRSVVRPKGLCQWKFPMTPSGIESATYRLVAQCLNQLLPITNVGGYISHGVRLQPDVSQWNMKSGLGLAFLVAVMSVCPTLHLPLTPSRMYWSGMLQQK